MNVTGSITRTELSLGALTLGSGDYLILAEGMDFGPVTWRRQEARSPFIHGAIPTGQTKDITSAMMGIRVLGTTQSQLASNIDALVDAVSQWTYQINLDLDGTDYTWQCYSADYAVGASDDRFDLLDVEVRLVIPRSPVPVAGPL